MHSITRRRTHGNDGSNYQIEVGMARDEEEAIHAARRINEKTRKANLAARALKRPPVTVSSPDWIERFMGRK